MKSNDLADTEILSGSGCLPPQSNSRFQELFIASSYAHICIKREKSRNSIPMVSNAIEAQRQ